MKNFKQANKNVLPIIIALKTNKILRLQNLDKMIILLLFFLKRKWLWRINNEIFRYIFIIFNQILSNSNYNLIPELYEFDVKITYFLENKSKSIFKILDLFERDIRNQKIELPQKDNYS